VENFVKIVRIGARGTPGERWPWVFIKVGYTVKDGKGRLSITGVEGPTWNGDCIGGCGQIEMHMNTEYLATLHYAPGWDEFSVAKLIAIWRRWHLNDMRAGCEHQRARGETFETHPLAECPECGYKLGSAWQYEAVPEEVLEWLRGLPEADRQPAWV
jgi:hypothetical protein